MARTLLQRFVEDVRVVVRCTARPMDEEFDAHVADAVHRAGSTRVVLVAFVGDGADLVFDARQRAELSLAGLFARPHAVLAPAVRPEVLTSMIWLGANIRTFGPHEFDDACEFLDVARTLRPALADALASMRALLV